jgi:hypothetical protein
VRSKREEEGKKYFFYSTDFDKKWSRDEKKIYYLQIVKMGSRKKIK